MTPQFPYPLLNKQQIIRQINQLAASHIPFLFVVDYKAENGYLIKQDELDERFVRFEFNREAASGKRQAVSCPNQLQWSVFPLAKDDYRPRFDHVVREIRKGNSFLVNLTQPTPVETNLSLPDLYEQGTAKYKLWLKDHFTMLSPETFVQIREGVISSFPMKGTIDASIPDAEAIILNDPKEKAEHATIVDLIRNDLSIVADGVEVERYRYIDRLATNKGDLLQVSSEICGQLPEDYLERLGDILFSLLPAGSICGAPKTKTLEIIEQAEGYDRGFYTGICGWFDGRNLNSAVMIRFVEQHDGRLVFKSGGGITSQSDPEKEYEELIRKVYVPVH